MSLTDTTDPLDPTVTTDQLDYAPGSTATITATDFGIGDDIQFTITVIDPTTGAILWSGPSWDAVAGSDGSLLTSFFVSSAYAGATIQLTATDAVTGQVASEVFTDSFYDAGDPQERTGDNAPTNIIDLTTAGAAVGPTSVTADTHGAIWEQGSANVSANGQFKAFLIVQQDGNEASEQGYNTGAVDGHGHFIYPTILDDKHLIGSASPIVNVNDLQVIDPGSGPGGDGYYGFVVSVNQAHDLPNNLLSLDALQIFQASDSTLLGTASADASGNMSLNLPGAIPVFDLGGATEVELNANLTHGNSHGDAMVLIPVSDFITDGSANYVYLYSAFGQENPTNGGFEQWAAIEHATTPSPEWVLFKDVVVGAPNGDGSPDVVNDGNDETQPVVETNPLNTPPPDTVVDHAGQALVYTVTLDNTGNVDITGVTAYDSLLGLNLPETGGSGTYYWNGSAWETGTPEAIKVVLTGDTIDGTNTDGTTLETNAIWTWTYSNNATQDDLENNGNPLGTSSITNTVTTHSTTDGLASQTASTSVAVDQDMVWPVHKSVTSIDYTNGLNHDSSESGVLYGVDGAGDAINYQVTLDNGGNLYMPNVAVFDSLLGGGVYLPEILAPTANPVTYYLVVGDGSVAADWTTTPTANTIAVTQAGDVASATNTDGTTLDMGAHWIWTYSYTATQADLNNNGNGHDYTVVPDSSGSFNDSLTPGYLSNLVTATSTMPDNSVITEYSATATPVDQDPAINVEKIVSTGNGEWYTLADANDNGQNTLNAIAAALGIDASHVHYGTATAAYGQALTYDVVVTNTGNVDLSNVNITDDTGLHFASIGSLTVGGTPVVEQDTDSPAPTAAGFGLTDTVTATGHYDDTLATTDQDSAGYVVGPAFGGLTAGFWAQHELDWNGVLGDDPKASNLVQSGVLSSTDVLANLDSHGMVNVSTGITPMPALGVLLGDANGNGAIDPLEATLSVPLAIAQALVNASLSTKSDARLNLLQQAVASQLNVDNHDRDPGGLSPGSDLLGTAVNWLLGKLPFSDGHAVPTSYTVDHNGNGVLDSSDINVGKLTLYDTVSTSSTDWTPAQAGNFNKDGYFVVDSSDPLFNGAPAVYATGQDLKNALQDFNQGQLVTSPGGDMVAWYNDLAHAQANTVDGLWKILIDHGIGLHA
jgi:uncharacterized repeat protein (TIGR01451 family)